MSSDDLKNSAQVWGEDIPIRSAPEPSQQSRTGPTPSDEPPSYTNVIESPPLPRQHLTPIQEISLLSSIKFADYEVASSISSEDRSTLTSTHQLFYTSPTALSNLLCQQSILPPRPLIHIKGTHFNSSHVIQTDFDLILNLTTLLDISSTPGNPRLRLTPPPADPAQKRHSFMSKRPAASNTSTLDTWCKLFTTDKSENKSLTLTRLILDLPTSYLEGAIRTLLATLKYRGKLDLSFPMQHQSVTIHKAPSNWFYSMLRLYPVKEYKIAQSVWEVRGADDGSSMKIVEEWWDEWKGAIANAILSKYMGKVGIEEWMEWKMGLREKERKGEWAVDGQWE